MREHVIVLQHVAHEHAGNLGPALERHGFSQRVVDFSADPAARPTLGDAAGLLVMGGPMNVDDTRRYPFLAAEVRLIEDALAQDLPIIGICLGSQLLAKALGARVYANSRKEIGWYPIFRTTAAHQDALIAPFGATETVFHWHGDTFDLPAGAVLLAQSDLCAHQAFRYGRRAYGLQFHVETTPEMIEAWLAVPENSAELAALPADQTPDLALLRRETRQHAARLADLCAQLGDAFCDLLRAQPR